MAGTLYVVATPLGNLEDITQRALRVLRRVDVIAAEDTRHSRKLLTHYGIEKPLVSYYDQVERERAPKLVEQMKQGTSIALISDAGTPGIADPGYRLVRAAVEAGLTVVPIPGPSAVAAVLSVCGLPTDRFVFEGFVPAKSAARRAFFLALATEPRTLVVYETARRLAASLEDLIAAFGGDRQVVVAREVTKLFEEIRRGSAVQVREGLATGVLKGEITLIVAGAPAGATRPVEELDDAIDRLRAAGRRTREVAEELAAAYGIPRRAVYERVVKRDP